MSQGNDRSSFLPGETRPRVSVIVPTYNRAALLAETVRSVLSQTDPHLECLVIDDGSTDDTEARCHRWAETDPRLIYHRLETKGGAQRARNRGVELARGDYFCFLDSDDLLHPDKIRRQIALFEQDPSLDLVVCQTAYFHRTPGDSNLAFNRLDPPYLERFLANDNPWATAAPLWKRAFFERVGPWDETLPVEQDYDQNLRSACLEPRVGTLPEALVFYRTHEGPRLVDVSIQLRLRSHPKILSSAERALRGRDTLTPQRQELIAARSYYLAYGQAKCRDLLQAFSSWGASLRLYGSVRKRVIALFLGPPSLLAIALFGPHRPKVFWVTRRVAQRLGLPAPRKNPPPQIRLEEVGAPLTPSFLAPFEEQIKLV